MGEVLLYSILFLSGRQIPSLLGDMAYQLCNSANRCLGETEPALEEGIIKVGPSQARTFAYSNHAPWGWRGLFTENNPVDCLP